MHKFCFTVRWTFVLFLSRFWMKCQTIVNAIEWFIEKGKRYSHVNLAGFYTMYVTSNCIFILIVIILSKANGPLITVYIYCSMLLTIYPRNICLSIFHSLSHPVTSYTYSTILFRRYITKPTEPGVQSNIKAIESLKLLKRKKSLKSVSRDNSKHPNNPYRVKPEQRFCYDDAN